jgi:hypothetical protein
LLLVDASHFIPSGRLVETITRRVETLSQREHDLISEVHPKVNEIKEDVETLEKLLSNEATAASRKR